MFYELVLFGSAIFWVVFAIVSLIITAVAGWDGDDDLPYGLPIVVLVAFAVFVFGFTNAWGYIAVISLTQWLLIVLGYILSGIGYSMFKFWRKCSKSLASHLKERAKFTPDRAYATWEEYLDGHGQWNSKNHCPKNVIPMPAQNKALITAWMGFWPFCLLHDMLRLSLHDLWNKIYDAMARVYQQITNHFEGKLR